MSRLKQKPTAGDIGGTSTRTLVAAGVAFAAGKGWIPAELTDPDVIAALSTVGVLAWGIYDKWRRAKKG
jgi:hypothetical protein